MGVAMVKNRIANYCRINYTVLAVHLAIHAILPALHYKQDKALLF